MFKIIASAILSAYKWLMEAVKVDNFAQVAISLLLATNMLTGIAYFIKPGQEIKIPTIHAVNGKPVTITKPVTIQVLSGWIPVVSPGGDLKISKRGFRFTPTVGMAYCGEAEPIAGVRWFIWSRVGLVSAGGRERAYPLGLGVNAPYLSNLYFHAGAATKWDKWEPGLYMGLSVLTR